MSTAREGPRSKKTARFLFPLTASCTLLAFLLCHGTQTLSLPNKLFIALLVGSFSFLFEKVLLIFLDMRFTGAPAFLLPVVSVLFAVLCFAAPETAYTFRSLALLTAAVSIPAAICILKARQGDPFSLLPVVGAVFAFIYCLQHTGEFTPDSYTYHEMAKTMFSDFGKIETVRQYVIPSDHSISFPYFYPLLIAVAAKFTGLGIYTGVLLNLLFACATAVLLICLSRRLTGAFWPGELCSFFLFINRPYLSEVYAARSIPANIFFVCAALGLFWLLILDPPQNRLLLGFWLCGLFAGITAVIRFDSAAFLLFVTALCLLLSPRKKRFSSTAVLLSGAVLPLLPWLCYSVFRFGSLWVSDNNRTAFYAEPQIPTYVYLPETTAHTLWTSPSFWLDSLLAKTRAVVSSLYDCAPLAWTLIPAAFLLVVASVLWLAKKQTFRSLLKDRFLLLVCFVYLFCLGKTGVYCLVEYTDTRYHSETMLTVFFVTALACARYLPLAELKKRFSKPLKRFSAFLTVFLLCAVSFWDISDTVDISATAYPLQKVTVAPASLQKIISAMDGSLPPEASVFFLTDQSRGYYIGGWTDRPIFVEPANIGVSQVRYLLQNFVDADYILLDTGLSSADALMEYLGQNYSCISEDFASSYALYQLK